MAKNKITFRLRNVHLLILGCILVSSCSSPIIQEPYYRYSVGVMEIENPVFVTFVGINLPEGEQHFVCPDSALSNCSASSEWRNRSDVFPFVEYGDLREDMYNYELNPYLKNKSACSRPSTYYTSFWHKLKIWPNFTFYPFDDKLEIVEECDGYDICYEKFNYGITRFDCYLQAIDSYWYDPTDPNGENPHADCFDAFSFSPARYRIAVREHYTPWQMIKLHHLAKKRKEKMENVCIDSSDDNTQY